MLWHERFKTGQRIKREGPKSSQDMKFYISEKNIGGEATKAYADKLIQMLREKGWDVEYGVAKNKATDVSEFGQEEQLQNAFADDFMSCIDELGI